MHKALKLQKQGLGQGERAQGHASRALLQELQALPNRRRAESECWGGGGGQS